MDVPSEDFAINQSECRRDQYGCEQDGPAESEHGMDGTEGDLSEPFMGYKILSCQGVGEYIAIGYPVLKHVCPQSNVPAQVSIRVEQIRSAHAHNQ